MNRVRVRAVSAVVVLNRVGHVRLVVGRVKVLAVPARGEEDLSTHTVGAVMAEEVGALSPVGVVIVSTTVVYTMCESRNWGSGWSKRVRTQADVANSLIGMIGGIVCAAIGVTSDHAQARRERLDGLVLRTDALQVIDVEPGLCEIQFVSNSSLWTCL